MKLNNIKTYLLYFFIFLIIFVDLYFYTLRCEFSPPISTGGVIFGVFFQLLSIVIFYGFLEHKKSDMASNLSREEIEGLKIIRVAFVLFLFGGIGMIFQSFLRSDAMTVRGARSVGDACFSSPNLFLGL